MILIFAFFIKAAKKPKKYEEEEDFEESEDAESDITESDFEDPDEMEVRVGKFTNGTFLGRFHLRIWFLAATLSKWVAL